MGARRPVAWCVGPLLLALALAAPVAHAGLFDDDEARKAILDLREKIAAQEEQSRRQQADLQSANAANAALAEQVSTLKRSLLDLNNQIELMRGEMARLRGGQEQLLRDVADVQRAQKDASQHLDDRLRRMEPQKVTLDGREFNADPAEKRAYEDAVATLRSGDFDRASAALGSFLSRYPASGYLASARFWLGNAHYGKRDYKAAIATFRQMVTDAPDHPKAPEALLAIANSQAESKDTKGARRTLDELIKAYPQSEAASAGKDRLAALR